MNIFSLSLYEYMRIYVVGPKDYIRPLLVQQRKVQGYHWKQNKKTTMHFLNFKLGHWDSPSSSVDPPSDLA